MNAVAKAGNLSPYFKATSTLIASGLKPQAPAIPVTKNIVAPPLRAQPLSPQFMQACLPAARLRIKSGPVVTTQVRYAHTDIQIPDFDAYRRKDTQDPSVKSSLAYEDRKATTYLVAAGGFIATAYSAKYVITGLVSSLGASADVLALASIEVNIGEIPEGKSVVFKWRGKPIFVRHRTAQEISTEESVALSELRDPQHDKERATKPNWLVVIGVCTHLGCVPIADAGDFGGYYCPCHGSHYDASGRIRKGPAPLNLEVPPHSFQEGNILLIG